MTDQNPITPTDKELLAAMEDAINAFPPSHPCAANMTIQQYETELQLRKGRAILARWGTCGFGRNIRIHYEPIDD